MSAWFFRPQMEHFFEAFAPVFADIRRESRGHLSVLGVHASQIFEHVDDVVGVRDV